MFAIWNSYSKSETARSPRSTVWIALAPHVLDEERVERVHLDARVARRPPPRSSPCAPSAVNSGRFSGLFATATTSRSNTFSPRWMIARWPLVSGSKEPG